MRKVYGSAAVSYTVEGKRVYAAPTTRTTR